MTAGAAVAAGVPSGRRVGRAAAAATTAAASGFRFRGPRRTVRLRLTALYVGLFLASAACLLVITYFLVAQQLPGTLSVRSITGGGTGAGDQPESSPGATGGNQRHHRLRAAAGRHGRRPPRR